MNTEFDAMISQVMDRKNDVTHYVPSGRKDFLPWEAQLNLSGLMDFGKQRCEQYLSGRMRGAECESCNALLGRNQEDQFD